MSPLLASKSSLLVLLSLLLAASSVRAGTSVAGSELAMKSSGEAKAGAWVLDSNGYVGTYLRVDAPGTVSISVRASGVGGPRMNIVVADSREGFDLPETARDCTHRVHLMPGTYVARVELVNGPGRALKLEHLRIDGAQIVNENSDEVALAAADSYIEHFRRGQAVVSLPGVPEGTPVRVKLRRHAFNFGGNIHGFENTDILASNPASDSDAFKFQQFVRSHFNMLVCSNGGKWLYNEREPDQVNMAFVDACLAFAEANGMRSRMHTLLWDSPPQQPVWVNELLERAANGDDQAKLELRRQISERIDYYVRQRASKYVELDVLNEPHHQVRYWNVFGADGLAEIFGEVARATRQSGSQARLYLNEYNVLQWSRRPPYAQPRSDADPYANWYRELFESVRDAGGAVSGVGVQYYADKRPAADLGSPHSPARFVQVLQNLSVTGLPISLTEFGVKRDTPPDVAADVLEDTMRIVFGTPQAETFLMFGFWGGAMWDQAPAAALVDRQWRLTPVGERYEQIMQRWDTDVSTTVGADQTIRFNGFWGEYDVVVADKTHRLELIKGTTEYEIDAK